MGSQHVKIVHARPVPAGPRALPGRLHRPAGVHGDTGHRGRHHVLRRDGRGVRPPQARRTAARAQERRDLAGDRGRARPAPVRRARPVASAAPAPGLRIARYQPNRGVFVCGIVGYIGRRDAIPILLEGLRSLEYRGYDSAGLAVIHRNKLQITKTAGRVQDLRAKVNDRTKASIGIGHTRWATHGEPNDINAHPHTDTAGRIAVVHNGIIENAELLRAGLVNRGVTLVSDTDTEALAHMIAAEATGEVSLEEAVRRVLRHVDGTYGLVVLDTHNPNELVVARNGSPIVLGIGASEMFVASDVAALVRYTKQVVYLDDREVATVHATDYRVVSLDEGGRRTADGKVPTTVEAEADDYELGPYEDFMRKEIHEQPEALRRALRGRLDDRFSTARLGGINLDARQLRSIRQVKFLGCGSAYYAGQMGAVLVEELARIPSDAEPASEFRYRNPVVDPDTLYVAVSQSGETFETLMAVQELRRKGGQVIGTVNVVGSAIGRECGTGVFLHAGPEIAVAST